MKTLVIEREAVKNNIAVIREQAGASAGQKGCFPEEGLKVGFAFALHQLRRLVAFVFQVW